MRAISSYGQGPAQDVLAPYKRYFPESDPDNDYQTHVKDVLGLTAGTSSTDGAIESVVGTFVVDNLGELHIRFDALTLWRFLSSRFSFVTSANPFRRLCHEQQWGRLQRRGHPSLHTPRRSYRQARENPFLWSLLDSWKRRRSRLRFLGPLPKHEDGRLLTHRAPRDEALQLRGPCHILGATDRRRDERRWLAGVWSPACAWPRGREPRRQHRCCGD